MLHARGENNDSFLGSSALPLVDQDAANLLKKKDDAEAPELESRMDPIDETTDPAVDSGNESAGTDSDSEDKKECFKEITNGLVGMNVSSLIRILLSPPTNVFSQQNSI